MVQNRFPSFIRQGQKFLAPSVTDKRHLALDYMLSQYRAIHENQYSLKDISSSIL